MNAKKHKGKNVNRNGDNTSIKKGAQALFFVPKIHSHYPQQINARRGEANLI